MPQYTNPVSAPHGQIPLPDFLLKRIEGIMAHIFQTLPDILRRYNYFVCPVILSLKPDFWRLCTPQTDFFQSVIGNPETKHP